MKDTKSLKFNDKEKTVSILIGSRFIKYSETTIFFLPVCSNNLIIDKQTLLNRKISEQLLKRLKFSHEEIDGDAFKLNFTYGENE